MWPQSLLPPGSHAAADAMPQQPCSNAGALAHCRDLDLRCNILANNELGVSAIDASEAFARMLMPFVGLLPDLTGVLGNGIWHVFGARKAGVSDFPRARHVLCLRRCEGSV